MGERAASGPGGLPARQLQSLHRRHRYRRHVLAAKTVGLDIAGIDVVCESIKRPLEEQGGGIVEVNAAPGLRMHVYPSEGKSRPVGGSSGTGGVGIRRLRLARCWDFGRGRAVPADESPAR